MKNVTNFSISRRQLLQLGGASAMSLGSLSSMPAMRVLGSQGAGNYKALVCVFLFGGADSFNLLVPRSQPEYDVYAGSRGDLAEPLSSLLPITPTTPQGAQWGLHRETSELRDLFQTGRMAFLANAGPLVQPLTKAQYLSQQLPVPMHLFSHNNQQAQWQAAHADGIQTVGWAGRMLDRMQGSTGTSPLPSGITVGHTVPFLTGAETGPYVISPQGSEALDLADTPERRTLIESMQQSRHKIGAEYSRIQRDSIEFDGYLSQALPSAPSFAGMFPAGSLGQQMRMVAQLIAIRQQFGATRQVFFVGTGNYDTHDDHESRLPALFSELSSVLGAFQTAIDSLNVSQSVTTFTHSEFGRTLSSNGLGSDHGWGGHGMVLGGAVQGGEIYGTMPSLALDGPDDIGEGRVLPTTGVDQVAATLARWFGLPAQEIPNVFPNVGNFASSDLGFLV